MEKQKVKSLGMSAQQWTPIGLVVVVRVNGNNHVFYSNDPVEKVIANLSKYYELSSSDIHDIKFMW